VAVEQHQHQCLANHKAVTLNVEHEEGKKPRRLAKGAGLLKRGPRPLTAVLAAGLAVALLLLLLAGGRIGAPKVTVLEQLHEMLYITSFCRHMHTIHTQQLERVSSCTGMWTYVNNTASVVRSVCVRHELATVYAAVPAAG
jgi:hypothetical protein